MAIEHLLLTNLAVIAAAMFAVWLLSFVLRDASIADIFWGLGFVLVAWTSWLLVRPDAMRPLVLAILVTIWGLRLAGYLGWRKWGEEEDRRYQAMREHHGERFAWVSLFSVFLLQGALIWIVSLPVQMGMFATSGWQVVSCIGMVLWFLGLVFESVGDFQLAQFKADPTNKGQVMQKGLWRYTRHPNYFGDFLVWWGLYLAAAQPGTWWWTVIGPLVMSFLLLHVSGVRMLESSLKERKPGYADYVKRTSPFVPWPPGSE